MLAYYKKRKMSVRDRGVAQRGGCYITYPGVVDLSTPFGTDVSSEEAVIDYERVKLSTTKVDVVSKNLKDDAGPTTPAIASDMTAIYATTAVYVNGGGKRILRSHTGVSEINKRFVARILRNGEQKNLGTYDTAKEAALAFDRAVIECKFPVSLLNYPNELPIETIMKEDFASVIQATVATNVETFVVEDPEQKPAKRAKTNKQSSDNVRATQVKRGPHTKGPVQKTTPDKTVNKSGHTPLTDEDLGGLDLKSIKEFDGTYNEQIKSFRKWYEDNVTYGTLEQCKAQGKAVEQCRPALKAMQKLYWLYCEDNHLPRLHQRSKPKNFKKMLLEKGHEEKSGKTGASQRKVNDPTHPKKRADGENFISKVLKIKGYKVL